MLIIAGSKGNIVSPSLLFWYGAGPNYEAWGSNYHWSSGLLLQEFGLACFLLRREADVDLSLIES